MTNKTSTIRWITITLWIGLISILSSPVMAQENNVINTLVNLELRKSLVEPYMEKIIIRNSTDELDSTKPTFMKVWIMADDQNGSKIYFNQDTKKFGLARYENGESPFIPDSFVESDNISKVYLTRK